MTTSRYSFIFPKFNHPNVMNTVYICVKRAFCTSSRISGLSYPAYGFIPLIPDMTISKNFWIQIRIQIEVISTLQYCTNKSLYDIFVHNIKLKYRLNKLILGEFYSPAPQQTCSYCDTQGRSGRGPRTRGRAGCWRPSGRRGGPGGWPGRCHSHTSLKNVELCHSQVPTQAEGHSRALWSLEWGFSEN